MTTKTRIYLFVGVLSLGLAGAYYIYLEYNRQAKDINESKSDFDKEAIELIREFSVDEQGSNSRYLGKIISVSGIIKSVELGEGTAIISLGDSIDQASVRCSLDSLHLAEAAGLQSKESIVIKGYCFGFRSDDLLGSDVILNRCAIEIIHAKRESK